MSITSSIIVSRDAGPVPDSGSNPDARSAPPPISPESQASAVSVSGPLSVVDEQLIADVRLLLQKVGRQNAHIRANYDFNKHLHGELVGNATIIDTAAALVRLGLQRRGIAV